MTTPAQPRRAPPRPIKREGISLNAFILISLVVSFGAGLALMNPTPPALTFLFILSAWVLSVVVHEFGHAYAGLKAGDYSVIGQGYLTLDPFKYAHVFTSLILPLIFLAAGGIGFPGGAVYLREDLMRSPRARAMASLAGPLGTLAVLAALALALKLGGGFIPAPLAAALAFLAFLQAMALILNLLPVPGLDGYGVIRHFLPDRVRAAIQPFEAYAMIGLFVLLMLPNGPGRLLFGAAATLINLIGVPLDAASEGMRAFRFWEGASVF